MTTPDPQLILLLSVDHVRFGATTRVPASEKVLALINQLEAQKFYGSLVVRLNFGEGRLNSMKIIQSEQEIRI